MGIALPWATEEKNSQGVKQRPAGIGFRCQRQGLKTGER